MSKRSTLTWLHLSDLHACTPRFDWDAERVTETLIDDLQRLQADEDLRPDLLFFTGDAAFGRIGDAPEETIAGQLERFGAFLEATRTAFEPEIPLENVFLVPGNHDVDRTLVLDETTLWLDSQKALDPVRQLISGGGMRWASYIQRLEDYRSFLQKHGFGHLLADPDRLIYAALRRIGGWRVGVAGFNTAWSCGRDRERGRLWMCGEWQQGVLRRQLAGAEFSIALLHHPPDWLNEYEQPSFGRALERDFRFVLHGHEHLDWVRSLTSGHVVIAAAACYGGPDEDQNGYSLVRLDPATQHCEVWLRRYDQAGGGWTPRPVYNQTDVGGRGVIELPFSLGSTVKARKASGLTTVSPSAQELGAVWKDDATRFSLLSHHATEVKLCLFDEPGSPSASRSFLLERSDGGVWSVEVQDLRTGQLYGYRVTGPWDPSRGHCFNPAKLLVDPMARAVTGEPSPDPSLLGYDRDSLPEELSPDSADSAGAMPKCVVIDPSFEWDGVEPPRIPWSETVLYECHVRGLTQQHPEVDPELRGTYLGLVAPPVLAHLQWLGVTSLVLLPVQQIASEPSLRDRQLRNYWGYNPLCFCAPHTGSSASPAAARSGCSSTPSSRSSGRSRCRRPEWPCGRRPL